MFFCGINARLFTNLAISCVNNGSDSSQFDSNASIFVPDLLRHLTSIHFVLIHFFFERLIRFRFRFRSFRFLRITINHILIHAHRLLLPLLKTPQKRVLIPWLTLSNHLQRQSIRGRRLLRVEDKWSSFRFVCVGRADVAESYPSRIGWRQRRLEALLRLSRCWCGNWRGMSVRWRRRSRIGGRGRGENRRAIGGDWIRRGRSVA